MNSRVEVVTGTTPDETDPTFTRSSSRQPIVVRGRVEPLANVPLHRDGPLTRWLMASADLHPDLEYHIAVHEFANVAPADRNYCDPHAHPYDEIDIFHASPGGELRVAIRLGDRTIDVQAPATVFIPAGTVHAANVISGSGFMIAVLQHGHFQAVRGETT